MKNESAIRLWKDYQKINPDVPEDYDVWAFGMESETADKLAALVLAGTKTATSSNYELYEFEKESIPYVGLYNVILNGKDEAVAVIETTDVEVIPFDEVTEEHAYLEGEGDRSLEYWRNVHEAFFKEELEGTPLAFHDKIPVVCERFRLVYPK